MAVAFNVESDIFEQHVDKTLSVVASAEFDLFFFPASSLGGRCVALYCADKQLSNSFHVDIPCGPELCRSYVPEHKDSIYGISQPGIIQVHWIVESDGRFQESI